MSSNHIDMAALDSDLQNMPQKPRGWWSRNWKWFVPTMFFGFVIVCCGGPAIVAYTMFTKGKEILKSSPPYKIAMERIETDPKIKEAFGEPIKDVSFIPSGEMNMKNDQGEAKLYWDIEGPKGKGKAGVSARTNQGKWEIVMVEVTLPDGKKITFNDFEGVSAPPFITNPASQDNSTEEKTPDEILSPSIPMPEDSEPGK
jgi:hypothetical protein